MGKLPNVFNVSDKVFLEVVVSQKVPKGAIGFIEVGIICKVERKAKELEKLLSNVFEANDRKNREPLSSVDDKKSIKVLSGYFTNEKGYHTDNEKKDYKTKYVYIFYVVCFKENVGHALGLMADPIKEIKDFETEIEVGIKK